MIDAITKERLTVNGEALTGSNIVVPLEQLDRVTSTLTNAGVKFWVRVHTPLFMDEVPTVAIVSLSRTSNTADVQRLLDAI
jgi:hypothetical protein